MKNFKQRSKNLRDGKSQVDPCLMQVDNIKLPGSVVFYQCVTAPPAIRLRIKFAQRSALVCTSGVRAVQIWSMNGLFDPDFTGSGLQPEGFDEWMALYEQYRVIKSKITITLAVLGTTAPTSAFRAILMPATTTVAETTMDDAAASIYAQEIVSMGVTNPTKKLSKCMSVATVRGVRPQSVMDEASYAGNSFGNPTYGAYWHLYVEPVDAFSTVTVYAFTEIEYYVDFFEREAAALSVEEKLRAQVARVITPDPALIKAVQAVRLETPATTPTSGLK